MDFNGVLRSSSSSSSTTNNNNNNNFNKRLIIDDQDDDDDHDEDDQHMMMSNMSPEDFRRGPWTIEEDLTLTNYISIHGEGRWNSLATCAGLKRTGKSCRLRWLNYLRPGVLRGNITLEEQLLILELHSRWGNRWSKIAQHLPGRTDNEIKNYWRTRVQKHAKQLKCDVNSKQFKDTMRYLWMPRMVERINVAAAAGTTTINNNNTMSSGSSQLLGHDVVDYQQRCYGTVSNTHAHEQHEIIGDIIPRSSYNNAHHVVGQSIGSSSDSFGAQVSPVSDLTTDHNNNNDDFQQINNYCYNNNNNWISSNNTNDHNTTLDEYFQGNQVGYTDMLISPPGYYNNLMMHGLDFQPTTIAGAAAYTTENNFNNNHQQWFTEFISDDLWNNNDHHASFSQQDHEFTGYQQH